MFKELFGGVELPVKEAPEKLNVEIPQKVMTRIKLSKSDLADESKLYQTMWHMIFVDPLWYCMEENKKKMAELIPCFIAAKFGKCPFREGYFSDPETYNLIKDLMDKTLMLMPVVNIRKDKRCKVLGMNLNLYANEISGFRLENYSVKIIDYFLFGDKVSMSPNDNLGDINNYRGVQVKRYIEDVLIGMEDVRGAA